MGHGLARGLISKFQGGSFKSGFLSGLTSGFDVSTKGNGGILGRTSIMAIAGGTFSVIGGGKFSNGAFGGAMTHLFNEEMSQLEIDKHNQKVMANEKAFKNAYGKNGEAYMMGDTKVARNILSITAKSLTIGFTLSKGLYDLGYDATTYFIGGATGALVSSGIVTELQLGFGNTNYKKIIKTSVQD